MHPSIDPLVIAELKAAAFAAGQRYYKNAIALNEFPTRDVKTVWSACAFDVAFDTYAESVQEHLTKQRIDIYAEGRGMSYAYR